MSAIDALHLTDRVFLDALMSSGGEAGSGEWERAAHAVLTKLDTDWNESGDDFREVSINARARLRDLGLVDQVGKARWRLRGAVVSGAAPDATPPSVVEVFEDDAMTVSTSVVVLDAVINETARSDQQSEIDALLEARLKALSPAAFERLCQALLRACGFVKVAVTGRSGDGGIDGYGLLQISLINFPVLFQCKRYASPVGSSEVRDFRGAMQGRSDKGIVFTTSRFTREAHEEAVRPGVSPIELVDGNAFRALLIQRKVGIATRVQTVETTELDWAFFNELEQVD